ncbi:protein madd-4-like [Babylonia areolata]|uniref:protein madd-4-like n=1 Tax=Babylonia areolata TaxID=304850 RepID=UPI003FD2AF13
MGNRVGVDDHLVMVFFMTLFVLALPSVQGDHWDGWSSWSECSRTCDGGATYQERKCIRSYHTREGCEGERYRYNICNIQPCPPEAQDFRSKQCAAYNNATYGGKLYQWLPYTDRRNPCALYCIAKGTRTVVRLAPKVLDGTRCKEGGGAGGGRGRRNSGQGGGDGDEDGAGESFDMCISGKCWEVGCDHRLGSKRKVDLCGVCGGDNACLKDGQPNKGRYEWREVGLSQCSASCGVGVQVSMFQCHDTVRKKHVHDKRCAGNSLPSGRSQSCFRRRCPPAWKILPWQPCSASCGGGERSRAVRCMDTLSDGRQQWLHDSFCPAPRPALTQPCNRHLCPTWYAGQWSPCSVTCGWGTQLREVVCRHEGEEFCSSRIKPVTKRNCTTNFPCRDPEGPSDRAEHDEGGHSLRLVGAMETEAFGSMADAVHKDDVRNQDMSTPRFVVSTWSACSVTCGKGLRQRYVTCKVRLLYIPDIIDLDDDECEGPKPATSEECQQEPCYRDYEWRRVGMTPCDRSCLGGTQESVIRCVHKDNGTKVPNKHCHKAASIPKQRKICNDIPCPQRWRIGDFGPCSTTCGGGLMSREVTCIQEVSRVVSKVLTLPDFMCQKPVPQRARQCNTQFCPADWATGFWSECSVTCGEGVELRPVVCQRVSRDGTPIDVDEYLCPPTQRPPSERPCKERECPKVRIKRQSIRFFQLNKMDRVRLVVGTVAAILPGTSVVVSCPVRGMSKRSVQWLKNQRPVKTTRRSFISNNGKLRIRRSRPERDSANYTCVAGGQQAELEIQFSDLYALVKEAAVREKYLLGSVADSPSVLVNSSAYHKDPFDRQKRPLHVVIGEWSACSATCDGGRQTRLVSCEIITKNYYERFPSKVCRKAGLYLPASTKKCNLEPCVKWTVTRWTPCSVKSCTREGRAMQKRTIRCTAERNASYVSDRLCDVNRKPEMTKECKNPLCVPMWNTSEWSLCSADCGEEGSQIRMLTCTWENTGLPAGRVCEGLARPPLSRPCRRADCNKHACRDVSSYCRMVKMMSLCRYSKFKYKCCKTCRRRRRKHLKSRSPKQT